MKPKDPYSEHRDRQAAAAHDEWQRWIASLTPEERRFLVTHKIDAPEDDDRGNHYSEDPSSWSVAAPTTEQNQGSGDEVAESFSDALRWVIQADTIGNMGRRLVFIVEEFRPALVQGIVLEIDFRERALREFGSSPTTVAQAIGERFGAVLEWLRRGRSFPALGQRALAMVYAMGLSIAGSQVVAAERPTLQQIANPLRNTRQASSRLVCDARDTFNGLRSQTMRPEKHRLTCRNSQLKRTFSRS